MSMELLGDRFDVHTGGNDNKFPHHEDEIAQSEGYAGHEVVSIWVHGGFLQMGEQKMAKSQGNVLRVPDLAEHGLDPLAYRLLCFGTRYRSEMDFSWEALEGANARLTGSASGCPSGPGRGADSPRRRADAAKAFEAGSATPCRRPRHAARRWWSWTRRCRRPTSARRQARAARDVGPGARRSTSTA